MTTPTPSCTCTIAHVGRHNTFTQHIVYCPLHAAAPDMRDALDAINAWNLDRCPVCKFGPWEGSENHLGMCPMPAARAALDKARSTTPTT